MSSSPSETLPAVVVRADTSVSLLHRASRRKRSSPSPADEFPLAKTLDRDAVIQHVTKQKATKAAALTNFLQHFEPFIRP
jgi:hypothetical protein